MNTRLNIKSIATCSFLVISIVLCSCETCDIPEKFVFGNAQALIQTFDDKNADARTCPNHEGKFQFDGDNDNNPDIVIKVYEDYADSEQETNGCTIYTDDFDIEFGYQNFTEDIFINMVTSDSGQKKVVYNEKSHYHCEDCQNLGAFFTKLNYSSPALYQEGEKLGDNLKWSHKLQLLTEFNHKYRKDADEDILVQNYIIKGVWNSQGQSEVVGYLPIRSTKTKPCTYGWIKLSLIDHCSVEVMEIAWEK